MLKGLHKFKWLSLTLFLVSCSFEDTPSSFDITEQKSSASDSGASNDLSDLDLDKSTAAFSTIAIRNKRAFNRINDSIGSDKMDMILRLNRRDRRHIRHNDSLVVPLVFDEQLASSFPPFLEQVQDIPKLILVSIRVQALGAYEYGRLVCNAPISSGKRSTPTPRGLFSVNWRHPLKVSSIDSTWIMPWCVNFHAKWGVNFHEYSLPGYPASHACVRLPEEDAMWLYHWVDLWKGTIHGTPVIVFGNYAYGKRAPWKQLPHDPSAILVTHNELDSILITHVPTIVERQNEHMRLLSPDTLLAGK